MRILILNHYASIPSYSSAETRHFEIGKRLVSKGWKVTVMVGDYSHLLGEKWSNIEGKEFEKEGVSFLVVPTPRYSGNGLRRFLSSFAYYVNALRIYEDVLKDQDVIVASSPHPYVFPLAGRIFKKYQVPFVVELRDVWPDDLINAGLIKEGSVVAKHFDSLCRRYYPLSKGLITLMPGIKRHLERLGISMSNRLVIPNGLDVKTALSPKACSEVEEIISRTKESVKVLYTGSMGPSNGLDKIVDILEEVHGDFPEVAFVFVGSGSLKNRLIEKAQGMKNVYFFNPIPRRCVYHLFREADFLLFSLIPMPGTPYPAYSSNKLMDYMVSAKPIISVDIEGLILKETNGAFFFDINDPESFRETLKRALSSDSEYLRSMGQRNRKYILKNRDWNAIAEKFAAFLKRSILEYAE